MAVDPETDRQLADLARDVHAVKRGVDDLRLTVKIVAVMWFIALLITRAC